MQRPHGIQEHVILAPYTTMQIGGPVDFFLSAHTAAQVADAGAWALSEHIPVIAIGEGSNMVVVDAPIHALAIKLELPGIEVLDDNQLTTTVRASGGVHWDALVKHSVELGLVGLEALSMIPGTVGAAPVQNAGAYGAETADNLVEVEAFDLKAQEFVAIAKADCGFRYRSSRFRDTDAGRFIITSATFELKHGQPPQPTYSSLVKYLQEHHLSDPSVAQIRESVMAIRARILPDPSVVPNAGSFFKNPTVGAEQFHELEQSHPDIKAFAYGESFKISAGWLLDQCGFKGSAHFGLKVWDAHALVITNPQHQDYDHLRQLVELMQDTVKRRFGLVLEQEPLLIV